MIYRRKLRRSIINSTGEEGEDSDIRRGKSLLDYLSRASARAVNIKGPLCLHHEILIEFQQARYGSIRYVLSHSFIYSKITHVRPSI